MKGITLSRCIQEWRYSSTHSLATTSRPEILIYSWARMRLSPVNAGINVPLGDCGAVGGMNEWQGKLKYSKKT
jgi:hypothetical protein